MTIHRVLASMAIAVGAALALASPAEAAIQIGVAPSANGVVMMGVPTSIAASGFKGSAKVFRFDEQSKKWSLLGTVTARQSLPYTFAVNGLLKLRIAPKGTRASTFRVPVYGQFPTGDNDDPTTYGTTILNSWESGSGAMVRTARASAGCVQADIGVKTRAASPSTIQVLSKGAPEFRLTAEQGPGVAALGVPIGGDSVVTLLSGNAGDTTVGVVWTCLTRP